MTATNNWPFRVTSAEGIFPVLDLRTSKQVRFQSNQFSDVDFLSFFFHCFVYERSKDNDSNDFYVIASVYLKSIQ